MIEKNTTFKITNYLVGRPEEFLEKFASVQYDPEFLYIWVRAISAGEFFGSNANADYFPEVELKGGHPTFLNAKVFKNHENKQVEKAIGDVIESKWRDKMKCVELLFRIDRKLAPEIVRGFEKGVITDVSMGCRVKYTVCSVCGNKAKTRKDFCVHVRTMRNELMPDGKRVYEINYEPKFHDISVVIKGADRTAKVLEFPTFVAKPSKTASFSDIFSEGFEKAASLSKLEEGKLSSLMKNATIRGKIAEITKIIKDKIYTLAIVKKLNKNLKNIKKEDVAGIIKASEDFVSDLTKEAGGIPVPKFLDMKGRIIGSGAIGVAGTYEQGKRMRGERTHTLENILADNTAALTLAYFLGAKGAYKALYKKHQNIKNFLKPGSYDPFKQAASFDESEFEKFATNLNNFSILERFEFDNTTDIFKDDAINKEAISKIGAGKLTMVKSAIVLHEMGKKAACEEIKRRYAINDNDVATYLKIALNEIGNELEKEASFAGSVFRNMVEDNLFARPGFTAAALPATLIDGILFTKLLGTDKHKTHVIKQSAATKNVLPDIDSTKSVIGG